MKKMRNIVLITALICLILGINIITAEAGSRKYDSAAKKDFGQWLAVYYQFDKKFYVSNLFGKSIPEMITTDGKRKVSLLYYDPKKSIHGVQGTKCENILATVDAIYINKKLKRVIGKDTIVWKNERTITLDIYDFNGKRKGFYRLKVDGRKSVAEYFSTKSGKIKKISNTTYQEASKKLLSSTKKYTYKNAKYYNTAVNRKKYLNFIKCTF